MRSDTIKRGYERAPHRSLLKATGNYRDEDIDKPFIAIANSHVDIIPGHAHLDAVGQYVKKCVREAGGVPFLFNTIGVDDGIAMRLGEIARGTEGLLDPNRRTVTGKTLGENIAEYDIREKGERIQTVGLSSVRSGELATSEWAGKLNRAALRRMSDAEASEHQGAAVLEAIRSEAFDPLDCIRSVDNAELDQRRSAPLSEPLKLRGYLARYASRVTPASKGAVLKQ